MYTSYFGLTEKPFTITPDPRYLFMSTRHGEALAHLIYGVTESDGFIQLTGEVGTGKTTLIRSLLLQLPENTDIALVLNPQVSAHEFVSVICRELKINVAASSSHSLQAMIDHLTEHLLEVHAAGRRVILVVDEAQHLAVEVLEQVRLLTNLETARQKLLQIVLIGQPELRDLLARNDLRQLAQRVTARYHLEPLSRDESFRYIDHRLQIAGAVGELFTPKAKKDVFRLSKGIPRVMNVICDRAMLGAYVREQPQIDHKLVRQAAVEIAGKTAKSDFDRYLLPALGLVGAAMIIVGLSTVLSGRSSKESVAAANNNPVSRVAVESTEQTPAIKESIPPAISALTPPSTTSVSLSELLVDNRNATGTDTAFATLFAIWKTPYESQLGGACEAAKSYGLDCLYLRGSWSIVRQLNRPVILTLADRQGEAHQVVLTRLTADTAQIAIGPQLHTLPLEEISDYWFGESLLIWKPPNGSAKAYRLGIRDPGILWLRQSLAAIQNLPVQNPNSELFDAPLERRVKDYQRTRRLKVDGLVGQQTQIIINTDLGLDGIPQLAEDIS